MLFALVGVAQATLHVVGDWASSLVAAGISLCFQVVFFVYFKKVAMRIGASPDTRKPAPEIAPAHLPAWKLTKT